MLPMDEVRFDRFIERMDRFIEREDERAVRMERFMQRLDDRTSVILEESRAERERAREQHERIMAGLNAVTSRLADLGEQVQANTRAAFAMLDRLGPANGQS